MWAPFWDRVVPCFVHGAAAPHEWGKIFYKKEWASDRKHFSNII